MKGSEDKRIWLGAIHLCTGINSPSFGFQVTWEKSCYLFAIIIICASDLAFVVSKDIHHLRKLLENEASYMIYESGQVVAYFSADIQSQCWTMDFSAYPRDTHICEFLIYSPTYLKVGKLFNLNMNFLQMPFSRMSWLFKPHCTRTGWYNLHFLLKWLTQACQKFTPWQLEILGTFQQQDFMSIWIDMYCPSLSTYTFLPHLLSSYLG